MSSTASTLARSGIMTIVINATEMPHYQVLTHACVVRPGDYRFELIVDDGYCFHLCS